LALGVSLSIWTDNITKGRADDIVEAVTSTYVGHYQVSTPAFRKDELIRDFMTPEQAAGFKNDFSAPRIHFASLLSSGENSMPIQLDGIDPEGENKITKLKDRLTRGEYLSQTSECEDREILISEEQAEKLNVDLGAKLVIVGPATDGTLGNDLFRVKGIYKTDSKNFDKRVSFAHHNCVAATGMVGGPHEIVFGLPPGMDPEKLEATLKTQAQTQGLQLTSWKESVPQLYSIVRFSRALHNAINFILFLMISIGIVNVMMMTVFERTREFGVMSALGTKSRQVVNLVLFETIGIAVIGLIAGSIIGSAIVIYHHFYGFDLHVFLGDQHSAGDFSLAMVVYPKLSLLSILKSSLITVCFMLVAGFYPALRASKLTPIEAMRTL
ncbi:MAG: FtsX-like permease family protein, partial [Pseudobdellovibrionaceae bacterium]